ncbi:MAG: molybdopterin molybdenumtransferase MoeA [Promethearchaeota archaeon]|nr:MAG: molybdopterin molybdenumtransferase MoeA [Candidatus Lokiarchaeota archaeon]
MKFLKTISVEEFRNILESIQKITTEEELVNIEESFNRVISRDITSNIDVPHFRKSRMDGYAVIAEDTFGADEDNLIELELIETIQAGDIPQKKLNNNQCSYVATGAAVPKNSNGVVMVEFAEVDDNKVLISKAVTPGTHVIEIGHDIKKGEIIVKKIVLIDLATIGILASCGIKEFWVYKQPKVSLMSTGNEIVSQDIKELEVGKIYDVNSVVLKKAIENTGARVKFLGIIKDDYNDLKNAMDKALKNSNIVILSGGTSKGEGDFGLRVLEEYNDIEILIHGVKIKPGKPIIFVKLKEKIIFILPGYPTSALSCYYVFIDKFLRKMSGFPLRDKFSKMMEVGERIYSTVGRHEFKTVKIQEEDGQSKIFPIKTGSEAISTMFYADGYIEIEELESIIERGDKRRVYFF